MLRFLGSFQPPSASFQAWLFQIARNLATDHYRKKGNRNLVELEENLVAVHDDPDITVERRLTRSVLRRAMESLTEDQRDVIVLRFVAGMPLGEVAEALNKSEDAIKGLQRRALLALREILNDWEIAFIC
jgi:RNA polymerase sigma-70 factor (ECF subfamily)